MCKSEGKAIAVSVKKLTDEDDLARQYDQNYASIMIPSIARSDSFSTIALNSDEPSKTIGASTRGGSR